MLFADKPRNLIFWTLVLFWLLFGIKIGSLFDSINALALAFIGWGAIVKRRLPLADPILLLICLYGIHSNIVILAGGTWDQWHLFQPWRAAINYLGVVLAVGAMKAQEWKPDQIVSSMNIGIYAHALIIIATFLVPEWRAAMNSLTGFVDKSYLRSPGLTHSYGITSLMMAFPFVSAFFIRRRLLNKWAEAVGLLACFISLFLTARVGLYSLPFILGMVALGFAVQGRLKVIHLGYAGLPILILVVFVQAHSQGWMKDAGRKGGDDGILNSIGIFINEGLSSSLEIYFSAQEGEAKVQSTETIGSFLFHNQGFLDGLFGTGLYGRGDPLTYLATDISYAHFFSMVGLVGVATLVLIYILPLLRSGNSDPDMRWIGFVLTAIILVGNYKEATFFTRNLFSLWAVMVACLGIQKEVLPGKKQLNQIKSGRDPTGEPIHR